MPKKCYLHLVGKINREFPVEMNLVKINDTIYGDYYFSQPGNVPLGKGNSGKGIAFSGRMTSADAFSIKEYNTTGAGSFTGKFDNSQTLSGFYSATEGSKSLPFGVVEKYPEGSIGMDVCFQKGITPLVKKPKAPSATIQLVLLLPGESANPLISDSINRIILNTFTGKQVRTADPVKVLEGMKQVYSENYISSNEAIYSETRSSSFNWQSLKFMHVLLNDAHLLTFYIDHYAFTGGAHGLQTRQFSVVSLWTGREIGLKDVFRENSEIRLSELLTDKIHVMNHIPTSQSLKDAGFFTDTIKPGENFYLTREGVGFYYNQYDIAPYASGTIDLFIPFAELKELLVTGGPVRELLR
ncbi:MAG: DUF3298 domain-containing protein [Bacteroidetes bacterium]|nr:DUF3298 domain-containing protein [Bacteroidota bacterium]